MLLSTLISVPVGVLAVMAWPFIRGFFARSIIPAVRGKLGDPIADCISKMFSLVDNVVTATRRVARQLLATFQQQVLGLNTKFHWKNAATIEARTTSYLRKAETGEIIEKVILTTVRPEDLPREIRDALMIHREAELDVKEAVSQRMQREILGLETAGS